MNKKYSIFDLDDYLSQELQFDVFGDIDTVNGIQVGRDDSPIKKIAYAVDSTHDVITQAIEQKADILLVHHGFYWNKIEPIVNSMYKKTKALIESNMALYAIHLPLDAHMQFGNNYQLALRLGLTDITPFGKYKGVHIGTQGTLSSPKSFQEIYDTLFTNDHYTSSMPIITKEGIVHQAIGGHIHTPTDIQKIAIISGGGTGAIEEAYAQGVDLFITGDANHTAWLTAKELGVNVLFAGHYYTEVWGVIALGIHIQKTLGIEGIFIDVPTAL